MKGIFILTFFISTSCFAKKFPLTVLPTQNQKSVMPKVLKENKFDIDFRASYHLPKLTYHYLDAAFTTFYQKISFSTSIANSTFEKNSHYKLVAIPVIPANNKGFQLELFGHFSEPFSQSLSNFSADHLLYDYRANSKDFNIYNSTLSLGGGISFKTSRQSKVKIVISNNIPGYGNSNALFGFETKF